MAAAWDHGAFLGLPAAAAGAEARAVVLPVPYEATVTWEGGTARGPAAILEASRQVEYRDEWLADEARRFGVRTAPPVEFQGPPEALAPVLEEEVGALLDAGRLPLLLGGEHSLSLGPIRAALVRYPGLVVLHLDAHPDLRDAYEGTRYGHGCVMRRVLEAGARIHAFGIRAVSPEEWELLQAPPPELRVVPARELLALPPTERAARVLADLPAAPLWLSFDVDGLDPAVVPATGTPEPGGVDWYTVSEVLAALARGPRPVVGMDLVELAPRPGLHAADFAAARLAHRMLLAGLLAGTGP